MPWVPAGIAFGIGSHGIPANDLTRCTTADRDFPGVLFDQRHVDWERFRLEVAPYDQHDGLDFRILGFDLATDRDVLSGHRLRRLMLHGVEIRADADAFCDVELTRSRS